MEDCPQDGLVQAPRDGDGNNGTKLGSVGKDAELSLLHI